MTGGQVRSGPTIAAVVALHGVWTSCCNGAIPKEIPRKYQQKPWC
jgi:hypothetical protein